MPFYINLALFGPGGILALVENAMFDSMFLQMVAF